MTTRSSGKTVFTTPSDTEVVATRTFDAPRDLVWDAFTNPEHIPKWLVGPDGWEMPVCEVDLRVGGKWRYVWARTDGSGEFAMYGEYREVVHPERIVNTETFDPYPASLNTTVFTEQGGRTLTVVRVVYTSKEGRDGALGSGMTEGWGRSYDRLDAWLAR